MTRSKPSARMLLGYLVRLSLGLGLLSLAIWANRSQIGEVVERRPDLGLFALGFALYLTGVVLAYVRWFFLVRALGLPFRLRAAIRLGFIGTLFNMVIPGAVGGDFVKAAYLLKEQSKKTQAAASVAIDRVIGLLGLFILSCVAGAIGWGGLQPEVRRLVVAAALLTACVSGVLLVAFMPSLYRPLAVRLSGRPKLSHALHELAVMGSAYRRRLDVVLGTVVLASFTHVLNVTGFYVLGRAMFPDVPGLAQHLMIVPLVLFSTAIPLPFGALGVAENVSLMLFGLAGYAGGGLAMMAFHVCQYLGSFLGLFVYLANLRQVRALRAEAAAEFGEGDGTPLDVVDGRPEPDAASASPHLSRREAEPTPAPADG